MHFTVSLTALKHKKYVLRLLGVGPSFLQLVPDLFKTQGKCDKAVRDDCSSLQFAPDWFVKREGLYMWHDDYYDDNDGHWDNDDEDKFFDGYDGYKKRKAQKAKIKKELMPITWHPSRYWDWCMSEDEKKKEEKIMGINIDLVVPGDHI